MKISFFNTYIDKSAYKKVRDVLTTTFLSEGKIVSEFENGLSKVLDLPNPVTVNSGTSALHLALVVAGIKESDEVICPAQTFIATAMAIMYQKAKPVFCDVDCETGNIDPSAIEKKITKKTKAVMPVHWAGYPCDMREIGKIAKKHNLIVIEDAAHALGAIYKKKKIGTISPFTCFSFQAVKHLTTGDGGAISFLDFKKAQKAANLRWFGIDRKRDKTGFLGEREYNLVQIGYKYHLTDYNAVLGLANLASFHKRLQRRREIARIYQEKLSGISGLKLFNYKKDRLSSYWLFPLHIEKRDVFVKAMKDREVPVSVVHQGIDRNKIFGGIDKSLVNQRLFDKTQIHIPIHEGLTNKQVEYIVSSIKKGW